MDAIVLMKRVLYSILPTLLLLLAMEFTARLYERMNPPMIVDLGQGFTEESRLFEPDGDGFMTTNPNKLYNFRESRFTLEKPEDTYRIVVLGGSSIFRLDAHLEAWPERLAPLYPGYDQVEIINCGGSSYGSHRLVLVAAEILAYDPDLILLYTGHNEFGEVEQLTLANLGGVGVQRSLGMSALYRIVRDAVARRRIAVMRQDAADQALADTHPDAARAAAHDFTPVEIEERMVAFERNLERIVALSRDAGVPLIMGTVPSNLIYPRVTVEVLKEEWPAVDAHYAQGEWEAGSALAGEILMDAGLSQSTDRENAIIRAVASRLSLPLADVEAAVIAAEPHHVSGETLFEDHCHLNDQGNDILIECYEQQISELLAGE